LAGQGWQVSALDVSEVALDRARAAARRAGVDVEWIHAGLLEASLGDRVFDLVSVQYPALLRTPSNTAEHALLASVAPGGHLLVVHHVLDDRRIAQAKASGFDPANTSGRLMSPRCSMTTGPLSSRQAELATSARERTTITTSFCMSSVARDNGYHAELDASKTSLKR
jgi:SAM-dependent methyltransferase